jgi:hypothetical protein
MTNALPTTNKSPPRALSAFRRVTASALARSHYLAGKITDPASPLSLTIGVPLVIVVSLGVIAPAFIYSMIGLDRLTGGAVTEFVTYVQAERRADTRPAPIVAPPPPTSYDCAPNPESPGRFRCTPAEPGTSPRP